MPCKIMDLTRENPQKLRLRKDKKIGSGSIKFEEKKC